MIDNSTNKSFAIIKKKYATRIDPPQACRVYHSHSHLAVSEPALILTLFSDEKTFTTVLSLLCPIKDRDRVAGRGGYFSSSKIAPNLSRLSG